LIERSEELRREEGLNIRIIGIADSGGAAVDEKGLNLEEMIKTKKKSGSVSSHSDYGRLGLNVLDLLDELDVDVLVDATPTKSERR